MSYSATSHDQPKLNADQQTIYDQICRVGHDVVPVGSVSATQLSELGLVTIAENRNGWTLRPTRFVTGFPSRDEAVRVGRAFFARAGNVLGVEGSDFHVAQIDGRWHFEAGRDPASN